MKKSAFMFAGLTMSIIGLFLILKSLTITGFVISEVITNVTVYIFPLVLVIGGILIATAGDGLQAYLERKEQESASPSLEGKVQIKEEKEFGKRYSGNLPWYRRIGKSKVEQVKQKNYISDYNNYQTEERYQKQGALPNPLMGRELKPENLIATRVIPASELNLDTQNRLFASLPRPTIHFSLNSVYAAPQQKEYHLKRSDRLILVPFSDLLNSNKNNFAGGDPVDVFFMGYAQLPKSARIIERKKGESSEDFKKRGEEEIKKMGYYVTESGDYGWGQGKNDSTPTAFTTKKFGRMLRENGYRQQTHSSSELENFDTFTIGNESILKKKYFEEGLKLVEKDENFRKRDYSETEEGLKKFHKILKRLHKDYPTYEEFRQGKLDEQRLIEPKLETPLIMEEYPRVIKEKVQDIMQKAKTKIKNLKQDTSLSYSNPALDRVMKQEGIADAKMRLREYANVARRGYYATPLKEWQDYWGSRIEDAKRLSEPELKKAA